MIEIGNTLRSARVRRGLDLRECEAETRIRARYLAALEEERFEVLPEPAYARGFLRAYATFLGIDARVLVEEYDDRGHRPVDAPEPPPLPSMPPLPGPAPGRLGITLAGAPVSRRSGRRPKGAIAWLAMGAVGAGVVALWAGAAWHDHAGSLSGPASHTVPPPQTTSAPGGSGTRPPVTLGLELVGSPGSGSSVTVRDGSAKGKVLFSGVIAPGATKTWSSSRPLWVRYSAASSVQFIVDGRPSETPAGISQVEVGLDGTVRGA
jgi:hypothetical protein